MIRALALLLALQATLTVRTVLVALPVTVTDTHGHRVGGLTAGDFRVLEDGRPQSITLFHRGEGAITVGLIVDHSSSMRENLPLVASAVSTFAQATRADDEMFLIGFNERVSSPRPGGSPFTSDPRALASALSALPALGTTALYDAIIAGLTHLSEGHWDKRTLIVVSDGGDNASAHTFADVQSMAARSDAVIYAIGMRGTSQEQSPRTLRRLCDDTGGAAYFPRSPDEVFRAFSQIVGELREQYTLGYEPGRSESTSAFRKIQVIATGPRGRALRVRTRAGVVLPNEQP